MAVMADVECLIVGAGVVGLAIARELARNRREVVVVEREVGIGRGISSRNSEVIHAGLYYPKDSLKARFCVEGKQALYEFCVAYGVAHKRCGKILVAPTAAQRDVVLAIEARARANGVDDLALLERADIKAFEPEIEGEIGLFSPSTGIIDSHGFMLALQGAAEAAGAVFAFGTRIVGGRATSAGLALDVMGETPTTVVARHVVLAAGHGTIPLVRRMEGVGAHVVPRPFFAKGNYFALTRRSPFSHLIYPLPEPGGLGAHLTLDLSGRARFGPDVEWLDVDDERDVDFAVAPVRLKRFQAAIRRYWPGLGDADLTPDYAGLRPKIAGPGLADADFFIDDMSHHGLPGLVALYGIESPGLTAALALATHVARMVARHPSL